MHFHFGNSTLKYIRRLVCGENIGGRSAVRNYEMSDLIYGSYFVKEQKAPSGFYLDENAYYFEITEHGKTVTVENEAGKGFVNAAQVSG